jgi:hypothetical protein
VDVVCREKDQNDVLESENGFNDDDETDLAHESDDVPGLVLENHLELLE